MGKRTASVVLILEECEAGLGRFMGCIMAIVLIMGLCGPVAVRAEVVLEASEIDSSTVEVERVPVAASSLKAGTSDSTQVDSSRASRGFQEVSAGSMDDIGKGGRAMHSFLGFLGTVILLLAMVNHAHADTGREDAEGLRAGVVLEGGDIDSSTVEVGALAVIVHMQEKPHPILREWEQLVTTRGYVQSVDAEVLPLALERNGRPQRIAVDRIQRLTLMGVPSSETVERNSAQVAVSRADSGFEGTLDMLSVRTDDKADTRIGKKLAVGVLGGVGGGLVGAALMVSADRGDFGVALPALLGFWGGNLVGTAVGVSWIDSQDNFLITLAGSALLGAGVPYGVIFMFADVNNETAYGIFGAISVLSAFLGPIVGATIASERWRKPLSAKLHLKPEARRVSVGLVPNPKGGLSAIATLRF